MGALNTETIEGNTKVPESMVKKHGTDPVSKKDVMESLFCHSAPPKGWDVDASIVVPKEPLVKKSI